VPVKNWLLRLRGKILFKFFSSTTPPFQVKVSNKLFNAENNSDISDHLNFLYIITLIHKPEVIMELGTRGGESTRVFHHLAHKYNLQGYSVDLVAQPGWLANSTNWKHFESDDISFGNNLSKAGKFPTGETFSGIDLLFIDTSHEYEHTKEELKTYWPLVKPGGLMIFHDTNLTNKSSRRLDGTVNRGWDNQRGVTRAIEEFFDCSIEENSLYVEEIASHKSIFLNVPWCNGLLVLRKG
jgi:predicted O-methyltransferase YrrM